MTVDRVISYGHSFTMGTDSLTGPYPYASNPYAGQVAASLGVSVSYRGRSATRMLDTVRAIIAPVFEGSSARLWAEGTGNGNHVVLLENVHNDESSQLGGSAKYRTGYDYALRLALGVFGSRRKILAADASYASPNAWRSVAYRERAPGGAMSYTKKLGAKLDFTVSGDTCHIATAACDGSLLSYGTMRIEVNGTTVGYWNGTDKTAAYVDTVDDVSTLKWSPAGVRVVGMSTIAGTPGKKTLTLRKVDDTTLPIWVSAVYLTSGTPPRVFVGLEPPRNPDATDKGTVANFNANDPAYRALITAACADYNYVTCVDLAPGWDNATMVATGVDPYNFHPNEAGMTHLADTFLAAIDGGS